MDQTLGINVNPNPGQRRKITKADTAEMMKTALSLAKDTQLWLRSVTKELEQGIEPPFTDQKIIASFLKILKEGNNPANKRVQKFLTTVLKNKQVNLRIRMFATPCGLVEIRDYNLKILVSLLEEKKLYEKFCKGKPQAATGKTKRAGRRGARSRVGEFDRTVRPEKKTAPRAGKSAGGGAKGVDGPGREAVEGARERFKTRVEKIRVKPVRG